MDGIRPSTQPVKQRVRLDDQALRGRMRAPRRAVVYERPHATTKREATPAPSKPLAPAQVRQHHVPKPVHHAGVTKPHPVAKSQTHKPTPAAPVEQSPVRTLEQHAHNLYTPNKHPVIPKQQRSGVLHRQSLRRSDKKHYPKYRRPLMPALMTAMAIMLFSVGVFAVVSSLRTDKTVRAQVEQLAKTNDEEGMTDGLPSEDNPPNVNSHTVAPDLPRFLSIDKLNVKARVRQLGVGANNVMKAPSNIYDVGWYEGSSKPGQNGTVVMDGHVSGPTKNGVFYGLGSLKPADKINVERGDGEVFEYVVTGSQVYDNDKVDMSRLMTTSVPGKPALNLITCTGRFNVRTNEFEKRIVVFAVLNQ